MNRDQLDIFRQPAPEPVVPVQTPACDRCTQGVMDSTNPHLLGTCGCACHKPPRTQLTELRGETFEDAFGDAE